MKYWQYLVRRLAGILVSLIGLSIIIFTTSRVLPGNPARMALGALASEEQVQALAAEMGLNKPIPLQYLDYMRGLLVGDLGTSLETKRAVSTDIVYYLPATLELITVSMFLTIVIGIPLGVIAAQNKDGFADNATRLVAFFSVSVPGFFIAIMFQLIFGYLLEWLPITGRLGSEFGSGVSRFTGFLLVDTLLSGNLAAHVDAWAHIILPALALSLAGIGQVMRITRSSMIDVKDQDYVEAERGFGLPSWLVTYKYTLKNAFIPTLTILGLLYASLLGNAFLIELVYSWPGLASYGVTAVLNNDFNAVVGVTMTIGVAFVSINFLVDVLLGRVDPRIRLAMEEAT
ncbi:peptide ABC transporter [Haloferax sp. Atlit-12N]|uniref:ABC transporter permease n=1 Tax=Haloferax sp. Atlit-12N TaxID=2077203 RepID=UPI000E24C737|nr:ABC transporter permease [Haloferax sp. Atlit-12N]RDZ62521.1 peptide ABC transporter [Haloferax sp. Atlit-12N]